MTMPFRLPYYPRPQFLAGALTILTSGLQQGVTLFAPRRQGKTTFVQHELMPAAEEAGWQVVYLDLWRLRSDPGVALVEGIEEHVFKQPRGLLANWRLRSVKGTLKATGPELQVEAEPEKKAAPSGPQPVLENRLAAALDALVERSETTLLILDEFQALASGRREDFIAAFRTALQKHRGRLLVFYTGSSRSALNTMFRRARAPLFQSAHSLVLPDLDRGFVEDRAGFLHQRTGTTVDVDELNAAFERLGRSPEFLNWVILDLMVRGDADVQASMRAWLEEQRTQVLDDVLDGLSEIDFGVLLMLAIPDHPACFSTEGVEQVQGFCEPEAKVSPSKIQTTINRLTKRGLVAPTGNKGEYEIEDKGLLVWLRECMGQSISPAGDGRTPAATK